MKRSCALSQKHHDPQEEATHLTAAGLVTLPGDTTASGSLISKAAIFPIANP